MRNRNLFPTNFLIKKEADKEELFVRFIEWLNTAHRSENFSGSCDYYGLKGEYPQVFDEGEFRADQYEVLTLNDWEDIMLNNNYVQTWNNEYHKEEDCLQLSRYSEHPNMWALESDTEETYLGGHTALSTEVLYYNDETFLRNTADSHNLYWSDWNGDWICSEDDYVYYGYIRARAEGWFYSEEAVYVGHEWHVNSTVAEDRGRRYDSRRDEWVDEDDYVDEDRPNKDNAGYHSLARKDKRESKCKFSIGFEIEKEDNEAVELSYDDLYNETDWIKENDSSLDDDNGYELVSPIYDLYSSRLDEDIKNSKDLQALINGDYSSNCGGHINISSTEYEPEQLFEGIIGFMPLLYGLYENRLHKNYSEAKKKHKYYEKNKYSAIYIKDNVVELRLPPAVKNVTNLLWRRDLVRIMCENINKSESDVLRLLLNQNSKLYKHLRKIFPQDKLVDKIEKFIYYSNTYNNKKLPPMNRDNIKKDNISGTTNELGA
jgi:hypothetical protein